MDKELTISGFRKIMSKEEVTQEELSAVQNFIGSGFFIELGVSQHELMNGSTPETVNSDLSEVIGDYVSDVYKKRFGL